jgi:hypothetical protein
VWLVVAIPVAGGSRRIKIILPLYLCYMAIAEKQVIAVGVRRRAFTAKTNAG